jgi:outer membrane protein OmpA-like peptidoglycan-associated protein
MTLHRPTHGRGGYGQPMFRMAGVLVLAAALLTGCIYVPDWGNPVSWYDNVFDGSAPLSEPSSTTSAVQTTTDDSSFPTLSSVPDQVPEAWQEGERQEIVEGLVSDRTHAVYIDEEIRTESAAALPPPASTSTEVAVVSDSTQAATVAPLPPPPAAVPSGDTAAAGAAPEPVEPTIIVSAAQTGTQKSALTGTTALLPPTVIETLSPGSSTSAGAVPVASAVPTPAGGQATVTEVFNQKLMASASTVTTAPAHINFAPSAAQPLTNLPSSVPAVVRDTYNESLAQTAVLRTETAASGVLTMIRTEQPIVVKFSHGSATLSAPARRNLKAVVQAFNEQGGIIRVVGHASSRTRNMTIEQHKLVNFWISVDRAHAVVNELMRQGVSATAIAVEARGDSQPIYSESMPAGEAENRRAEVFFEF